MDAGPQLGVDLREEGSQVGKLLHIVVGQSHWGLNGYLDAMGQHFHRHAFIDAAAHVKTGTLAHAAVLGVDQVEHNGGNLSRRSPP